MFPRLCPYIFTSLWNLRYNHCLFAYFCSSRMIFYLGKAYSHLRLIIHRLWQLSKVFHSLFSFFFLFLTSLGILDCAQTELRSEELVTRTPLVEVRQALARLLTDHWVRVIIRYGIHDMLWYFYYISCSVLERLLQYSLCFRCAVLLVMPDTQNGSFWGGIKLLLWGLYDMKDITFFFAVAETELVSKRGPSGLQRCAIRRRYAVSSQPAYRTCI